MRRLLPGIFLALVIAPGASVAIASGGLTATPSANSTSVATVGRAAVIEKVPARPFKLVGTLLIPRLKLRSPIYFGITDAIFDVGIGHWPGTAKPGKPGNTVLGGHRTGGMMPFLNIQRMKKGDVIVVKVAKKTYRYKVTKTKIVKPTDTWITKQSKNATLTLFACHPPHSIKQRYIVQATLVN